MGKLKEFDIIFGNPRRTYKAGEIVTGYLILHLEEEMTTHGLHLIFSGEASVLHSDDVMSKHSEFRVQTERYFKIDVNIYPQDGIPVGRHEFPFTYNLPPNIPSSFDHHDVFGRVCYSVTAKLKVSWKKTIDVTHYFVVFRPLSLNDTHTARTAQLPIENKGELTACCTLGKITAFLRLPKRGYVPGETIRVGARVKNHTGFRISKVYFTLEQTYQGRSRGNTDTVRTTLRSGSPPAQHAGVPARSSAVWGALDVMTVPVTTPSRLDGCQIIDISYHLVLNFVMAGVKTFKRAAEVDILIGTEPLTSLDHAFASASAPSDLDPAYYSNEGFLPSPGSHGESELADDTGLPSYSAYTASQESMQDAGTGDNNSIEINDMLQRPPPPAYHALQE